ncbi:scavenger receptor cysteine-rich domain-containing protein DMBT1-like [Engystomops pustulosus]|uniref:scavenger receptor cysteine-rich domain-containing protein DMBT1-like n=1 Tax=Engystomops pustulosus TaxID=76066 RepID=UPI003AFB0E72
MEDKTLVLCLVISVMNLPSLTVSQKSTWTTTNIMEGSVTQHGPYSANLTFFNSPSFNDPVNKYPYFGELNQNLYLQATLETTDPDLVLFVDTCVASPDLFQMSGNVYHLIRNGCPRVLDYNTYQSSQRNRVRFKFRAFRFLNRYNSVFIQCNLVVCKHNDRWSRCNRGCRPRNKRSLESYQEHVHAVAGPLKLRN